MDDTKAKMHAFKTELRDTTVKQLNELVRADPRAIHKLMETRVRVNEALMKLDTPVVVFTDPGEPPRLGVLGLINGILGDDYRIAGVYDDEGDLFEFKAFNPAAMMKKGG